MKSGFSQMTPNCEFCGNKHFMGNNLCPIKVGAKQGQDLETAKKMTVGDIIGCIKYDR